MGPGEYDLKDLCSQFCELQGILKFILYLKLIHDIQILIQKMILVKCYDV